MQEKNTTTVVDLKSLMYDVNFEKMKLMLFVAELLPSSLSMQKTSIAFVNSRNEKTTTLAELRV